MIGFIKNLLGDGNSKSDRKDDWNPDSKYSNPINELQMLEQHTDIVRIMIKVDESRIASGADDGLIILWHIATGECVMVLRGHTLPITNLMLLERSKLISGSADKTIRIWDLKTGQCLNVLKGHEGSVKCIVPLPPGRFCSGGNDRLLCIWSNDGTKLNTIERREEENIQCLLALPGNRIITGSNSNLLLVYRTDALKVQILAYHRESVRFLVRISPTLFASGSMDGAVVVWQTESLTPLKILNNPDKYRNEDRVYIYNVKFLLPLGEKYLAAAIGNGYKVFDIETADCVVDCSNCHDAEVNCIISLYEGSRLITCSSDSSIKLWGTSQNINFKKKKEDDKSRLRLGGKLTFGKADPILLGVMWAHTDSVNLLLQCTENSFASCSGDGSVILWKDGKVESELRNIYATAAIRQQTAALEDHDVEKKRSDTDDDSLYFTAPNLQDILHSHNSGFDSGTESMIQNGPNSPEPIKPVRIPDYVFDVAERLRKEKKMSIDQIANQLRSEGHSENIVHAIIQRQQILSAIDN